MADETVKPDAKPGELAATQVKWVRDKSQRYLDEPGHERTGFEALDQFTTWQKLIVRICDEWDSLKDTNLIDGEIFSMIAEALDIDGEKIPPSSYNDVIHALRHEVSRANAKAAFATATLEAGGKSILMGSRKQNFITVDLSTGGMTVDEGDLLIPKHHEARLIGGFEGKWVFRMYERKWWEKLWTWVARRPKRKLTICYFYNPKIKFIGTRFENMWCWVINNTWISEEDPTPNIPSVEFEAKSAL